MISLDGVIQAPSGSQEDISNGFEYGGWASPYSDETYKKAVRQELNSSDYLLGRKTFEIWEDYWPSHQEIWPGINTGTKCIFSKTRSTSTWKNTVFVNNVDAIKTFKNAEGPDIQVWGSSELVPLLLEHDLVDELRLKIHPVILGKGKKLYGNTSQPIGFVLHESITTTTGVILAHYIRNR